jgi:hypothetical protein
MASANTSVEAAVADVFTLLCVVEAPEAAIKVVLISARAARATMTARLRRESRATVRSSALVDRRFTCKNLLFGLAPLDDYKTPPVCVG